jgi:hypothetical protein
VLACAGDDQIKAVAALAGIQFDLPKDYTHFETNLTPEYKAKFPHGKIPAWEGKDGFKLFEAIPIARYREFLHSFILSTLCSLSCGRRSGLEMGA